MLLRQSVYYGFARGIPGIINFLAIGIYTRLLTTEEFGTYSIIVAVAGFIQVALFQALLLILGRFLPKHEKDPKQVLGPVLLIFFCASGLLPLIGVLVAIFLRGYLLVFALAALLSLAQVWQEMNLRIASARIDPRSYGALSLTRAGVAIVIGTIFAYIGWGTEAPLLGIVLGSLVSWLMFGRSAWSGSRPTKPSRLTLGEFASYGIPLSATFMLSWVLASSDRLLIAYFLDQSETGIYAVGYDLAQNSLGLLLSIVNTASLPLAIRALEREGVKAAREQVRHNGELVFTVAFVSWAVLIVTGPYLLRVFLGHEFIAGASKIFPLIVCAAAIGGIKSFHFDTAFHLSRRSIWQVITGVVAASLAIVLNLVLIPRLGIAGAAWTTIVSLTCAAGLSFMIGRKIFPMPPVLPILLKSSVTGLTSFASMLGVRAVVGDSLLGVLLIILIGIISAFGVAILLDITGLKGALMSKIRRMGV